MIIYVLFVGLAYENLNNAEYYKRQAAQDYLSNAIAGSLIPNWREIEEPEVRMRLHEIHQRHNVPLFIEKRLLSIDPIQWFWIYGFEGRSRVVSDLGLRRMFLNKEFGNPIRAALASQNLTPCWSNGYLGHIDGAMMSNEAFYMRVHFDFFNKTGQARRAVIGGMYGLSNPRIHE